MAQTFSEFPTALQIILLQKENEFLNVRISYETEIQLNWGLTATLTHNNLESTAESGGTSLGKWQRRFPIWWSCPQRINTLSTFWVKN